MGKTIWLLVFFIAEILNAQIYDPFFLKTDRDYIKRLAWLAVSGEPIFYFDIAMENDIEKIIKEAQKLKVFLAIDMTNMVEGSIAKKFGHPKKSYFLPKNNWRPSFRVMKERKIKFQWAFIKASDIYRTSVPLTYAIKTNTDIYWLTQGQEDELLSKKFEGVRLKINLSAIKAQSPYRNLIPAHEVFLVVDDRAK